MKNFVIIEKSSGAEVYRYVNESAVEFDGYPFDAFEHREVDTPTVPPSVVVQVWTPAEFLRRMTAEERISARQLAKVDPIVEDFIDILNRVQDVRSDDPDTRNGLTYLTLRGVLAPGRVDEILGAI